MPFKYQKEIDTNEQSQTSPLFSYFMMRDSVDTLSLASSVSVDDETISLNAGHGFTGAAYEYIMLYENNRFFQQPVESGQISGNDITLKVPADSAYSTDAKVVRGYINLVHDYSTVHQDIDFEILSGEIPVDINNIQFISAQATDQDDGDFFGVSGPLTNGSWFRVENGFSFNLGLYRTNLDFRTRGATIEYVQKAPSGAYSTIVNFNTIETFGQVLRIDPRTNTVFHSHWQDNITGTTLFMILNGSYTSGE